MKSTLHRLVIILLLCLSTAASSEMIDYIVATVNGEVITYNQFRHRVFEVREAYRRVYSGEELEKRLKEREKSVLSDLIEECLLLGEAERENIEVDKIEIEKMLNIAKSKFKSLDDFHRVLRNEGLTLETLEKEYKQRLMIKKIIQFKVNSRVRIEDYEISQYYQAHKKIFFEPEQVKIRQILVKMGDSEKAAKQTAQSILKRIKGGENVEWEDLDFINTSELLPELGVAISKLEITEGVAIGSSQFIESTISTTTFFILLKLS